MATHAEVVVHNERTMQDMLSSMMRRAQDLLPVWARFGDAVATHVRETFATEGASTGHPWAPLSPAYAAWKLVRVGLRPILVYSGGMRETLTGRPMGVEVYGPREAEYGSEDEKLRFQQFGTRFMPARPPLVVTEGLNAELARLVADHLVGDEAGA